MNKFENDKQGMSLKCPSCGSALVFDPDSQKFNCEVCGSSFTDAELKSKRLEFNEEQAQDDKLKEYRCPSCGAEILTDETTTTKFCSFCGNPVVLQGRLSGEFKPDLIIPFTIGKEKACEILKDYLCKYSYVPSSFFKESNLEKITGIYYPFWEADINSDCFLEADAKKVNTWIVGDKKYTEVKYYKIKRRGKIHFEDISVNALSTADKKLVENVLPYPIKNHIPFNMSYLSGYFAKKNDLSFEDVHGEIKTKLHQYSELLLKNTIDGYDSVTPSISRAKILEENHDYALLPIWILNYKYRKKNYTFAVNGITGKCFGEIPLSKVKLGITFAGISAIAFGIISILGGILLWKNKNLKDLQKCKLLEFFYF